MANKYSTMPFGMATRKFYCHKCGTQLRKSPKTKMVYRGHPEYKKYSRFGHVTAIGDIEVTEYDFRCNACDEIIGYDDQSVIEYIQKQTGRLILSQSEISAGTEEAKEVLRQRSHRIYVITMSIVAVVAIILFYFKLQM